jgi:hypothetical protein
MLITGFPVRIMVYSILIFGGEMRRKLCKLQNKRQSNNIPAANKFAQ